MESNNKTKRKLYFSSKHLKSEFAFSEKWVSDFFEIVPFSEQPPHELLQKKYDVIELFQEEFNVFRHLIGSISWRQNQTGMADVLLLKNNLYFPVHLVSDCILQLIKSKGSRIIFSRPVMIIGTYDFVLPMSIKMALAGFSNLIISLTEPARALFIEKKINDFVFNVQFKFVKLSEITQVESASSILISNLSPSMDPDSYESLTYFNFLSNGAFFVDFQSRENRSLVEEARRAELFVIEESEILTLKYQSLIDFYKNSSLV